MALGTMGAFMLWRADEHEALTGTKWDEALARAAIDRIVTEAEVAELGGFWPGHPLDDVGEHDRFCSLYIGDRRNDLGALEAGLLLRMRAATASAIERYRATPYFGPEAHPPSLWMGETGLLVVAAAVGSSVADADACAIWSGRITSIRPGS